MSLEDYFNYEDDTENCYELENGELVIMPPESDLNLRIASFLFAYFVIQGVPCDRLRIGTEIVVTGSKATVRLPDLIILSEELVIALKSATRSTITMDMPPPQLVVEVVSPGKKNRDRDYRYKRSQYQARGISEYWIVDPIEEKVTVFNLVEGLYEETAFKENEAIASPILLQLNLTYQLTVTKILRTD
ncbi:Uma2 family endonuclease [Crocosphaera sp.]|uniref:Uma2 family endonuclease n=1 Tax=Crocosphaera sp. TaxID=2729996 RepID=UPI003F22BCA0|nr:Uma2 family endonuclease [Crocosphaera sp.]